MKERVLLREKQAEWKVNVYGKRRHFYIEILHIIRLFDVFVYKVLLF